MKKSKPTKAVGRYPGRNSGEDLLAGQPWISERDGAVWQEGYRACHIGTGRHRNPYTIETEFYEVWRRGWEARYYNDPSEKL